MLNAEKFVSPLTLTTGFFTAAQTFLLLCAITSYTTPTSAQIPTVPSLQDNDALTPNGQLTPLPTATPPTSIPPPTIEITSHHEGQQVPVGVLTIEGISSDDENKDCRVYADVNDMTPMRNVSGIGFGDVSRWNFQYTQDYQLITEGSNELTAKISCFAPGNSTPVSEWHTVNVTGVAGGQFAPIPTEEGEGELETDTGENEEDE